MGIRTKLHPSWFQGSTTTYPYFEGWYFKMSTNDTQVPVLAVIPGISRTAHEQHAFVQVITREKSWYVRFPYEAFHAAKDSFQVSIGPNTFSLHGITLALDWEDLHLEGTVSHQRCHPFPVSLIRPGIMGWYAYVPWMECFHGVVSTHHDLAGTLHFNCHEVDLTGAEGYIEKDWGRSFPSAWIWMQSNRFPSRDVSCMLSVARIPFLGNTFTGFLGFVMVENRLITFATHTKAVIEHIESDDHQASVTIRRRGTRIRFNAELGPASRLVAPRQGSMERMITESVSGQLQLTISDDKKGIWFDHTAEAAGIELSEAQNISVR